MFSLIFGGIKLTTWSAVKYMLLGDSECMLTCFSLLCLWIASFATYNSS